jgi:endoglucanase
MTPSGVSQADLLEATLAFYDSWKSNYLVSGCSGGELRVKSKDGTKGKFTVSEGQGYGLLFTVLLHDHDSGAQQQFDELYAYVQSHPSAGNSDLMAWAQDQDCNDIEGGYAATDGDLDIAYALLLADSVWGSDGGVDYDGEAQRILGAILASGMASGNYPLAGDWVDAGEDEYSHTRSSDLMTGHFKVFADATGDGRWNAVTDKVYELIASIQSNHASSTGLLPDFIAGADTDDPSPSPGILEERDGDYHYNACRVPWRIASDYLLTGDTRSRDAMRKINEWLIAKTGGDPDQIVDGYTLSGDGYGSYPGMAFVGPFMVAAMLGGEGGSTQAWLDELWYYVVAAEPDGYYTDSIKLASLIVVSALWRAP